MKKNFNKLLLLTVGIALLVAIPLLHIVIYAFKTDLSLWMRLYETRLKVILPNTLKLLLVVAILINLFGISLAWVVSRYNFWGKGFWEWALVLPFAVPGYVMAYSYASFVAPGGPFQTLWLKLWGTTLSPPSIYNLWGVALILSFINYPYVYLLTRASFLTQSFLYEEVAKVLGVSPWMRFLKVNLRLAYPGIMAGTAMALMEVLADFGTVTLLRYPTFTEAIYRQMTGRFDPLGASALSLVLILIALGFLYLERHYRGRAKYEQLSGNFKSFEVKRLNLRGTLLVNSLLFIFLGLTFLLPLGILVSWAVKALWKGAFTFAFLHYVKNTIVVSLLGATLATVFALPVAYLHAREGGALGRTLYVWHP
ncbi:MAG: ABC transporter permease subunit [Caldimicrobium sp.]|nr:ABC transporter permease subunit [Caldimicrobium sp.]